MMELQKKLKTGLTMLFENDFHLISEDLNERTISQRLAYYLQGLFSDYNVDCEYNGNIFHESKRKKIYRITGNQKTEFKISEHSVFPDIIVHKRKKNEGNLLIIEMKKSTNRNIKFDIEKVKYYTDPDRNTDYPYDFGCFLIIHTKKPNIKKADIQWYYNGKIMSKELFRLQQ